MIRGADTCADTIFERRTHAVHHSTSGQSDRRGSATSTRLPCRSISRGSPLGRLRYRASTDTPWSCSAWVQPICSLVQHRLPVGLMRNGWQPWLSTMATNLGDRRYRGQRWYRLIGVGPFLRWYICRSCCFRGLGRRLAVLGVQHQFENTVWAHDEAWNLQEVAASRQLSLLPSRPPAAGFTA